MTRQLTSAITLTTLLCICPLSSAQDLTLFESVAQEEPGNIAEMQNREQNALPGAPSFTLVGTSRIGSKYSATLATSDGAIVVVSGSPGAVQEIPDHPGYRLVDIGSRKVSIAGPSGMPCVAAADKGVTCGANGVSLLGLATAAPVAVVVAETATSIDGTVPVPQGDVPPDNPFAAALRAAAQNEANARIDGDGFNRAERFQPRRIPPEDVPQGMRVVRTPFGDRLVEQ
ncbi:MAG: hypothetical protein V4751_02040 [Pseudomonadota bacterium]